MIFDIIRMCNELNIPKLTFKCAVIFKNLFKPSFKIRPIVNEITQDVIIKQLGFDKDDKNNHFYIIDQLSHFDDVVPVLTYIDEDNVLHYDSLSCFLRYSENHRGILIFDRNPKYYSIKIIKIPIKNKQFKEKIKYKNNELFQELFVNKEVLKILKNISYNLDSTNLIPISMNLKIYTNFKII